MICILEEPRADCPLPTPDQVDNSACPGCGVQGERCHHEAAAVAPECDYWYCEICNLDWGHE